MTRKDYEMLAEVLNRWVRDEYLRSLLFVELGKRLEDTQGNFDINKWYEACK